MQARPSLIAFLLACFLLTGMVGLFASYAPTIPLDRALHAIAVLDRTGAVPPGEPDEPALPADPAQARAALIERAQAEEGAVGARVRLMVGLITVMAGVVGAGLLVLATRVRR